MSWLGKKQPGATDDVVTVGLFPDKQNDGARVKPAGLEFTFGPAQIARRSRLIRRGLTIGLGLSLFAVLVAFLEQNDLALAFFSLVSLVIFLLLMRPARRD